MSTHEKRDTGTLTAAADHWDRLAAEAESMAAWNRARGLDLSLPGQSPGDHQAKTYRTAAKTLRLEIRTGRVHCDHLRPWEECELHRKVRLS